MTLGCGGTCYFTAKSDLSALFDDIRLGAPKLHGHRAADLRDGVSAIPGGAGASHAGRSGSRSSQTPALLEIRVSSVLGGRLLNCIFGSAPLAPELRAFMEACLGFTLNEYYGTTEISGAVLNRASCGRR